MDLLVERETVLDRRTAERPAARFATDRREEEIMVPTRDYDSMSRS